MKMCCSFALIKKNVIEKTEAVMEMGSFTIRDFSKDISDFCDRLFSDKEPRGDMMALAAEGIDVHRCLSAFGTEESAVMIEQCAGCIVKDRMGDLLEDILLDIRMIGPAVLTDTSPVDCFHFDIERILFLEFIKNDQILFVYVGK